MARWYLFQGEGWILEFCMRPFLNAMQTGIGKRGGKVKGLGPLKWGPSAKACYPHITQLQQEKKKKIQEFEHSNLSFQVTNKLYFYIMGYKHIFKSLFCLNNILKYLQMYEIAFILIYTP